MDLVRSDLAWSPGCGGTGPCGPAPSARPSAAKEEEEAEAEAEAEAEEEEAEEEDTEEAEGVNGCVVCA
jgi:hypothetical protein